MSKDEQNEATTTFLIDPLGIPSPLKHNRGFSAENSGCETDCHTARSLRTSRSAGVSKLKWRCKSSTSIRSGEHKSFSGLSGGATRIRATSSAISKSGWPPRPSLDGQAQLCCFMMIFSVESEKPGRSTGTTISLNVRSPPLVSRICLRPHCSEPVRPDSGLGLTTTVLFGTAISISTLISARVTIIGSSPCPSSLSTICCTKGFP